MLLLLRQTLRVGVACALRLQSGFANGIDSEFSLPVADREPDN